MGRSLDIAGARVQVFGHPVRIDEHRVSATVETRDPENLSRPPAVWAVLLRTDGVFHAQHIGGYRRPAAHEQEAALRAAISEIVHLWSRTRP